VAGASGSGGVASAEQPKDRRDRTGLDDTAGGIDGHSLGVVPGLKITGANLQEALKDSSQGAGLGRSHERIRAALVISEVALACMLLVSAGLLLRSFLKVHGC